MKTNAISKINKIGKIGNVITIIARIVAIMSLVICIAGTIFFAATPEDFVKVKVDGDATVDVNLSAIDVKLSDKELSDMKNDLENGSTSITYNSNDLTVNSATVNDDGFSLRANGNMIDFSLHNMFLPMLAACLYLTMTTVALFFVSALCKAFSNCQSPFEDNVITKMKHLAFSLIPWVILSSIPSGLEDGMLTGKFNFTAGVNLDTVLVIVLILGLTYIFQYGAVLQQESDETL